MKKIIIIIPCLFIIIILVSVGFFLKSIRNVVYNSETFITFLEKKENKVLDTTSEKNTETFYQIVEGKLYYVNEGSFYMYDYENEKTIELWNGNIPANFKIINNRIYYIETSNNAEDLNYYDIVCRDLNDIEKKKTIINNIASCVYDDTRIYYSKYEDMLLSVYKYDKNESEKVLSINIEEQDDLGYLKYSKEESVYFLNEYDELKISLFNVKDQEWKEYMVFAFDNNNYFFKLHSVYFYGGFMYIEGAVCDKTKSSLAGSYEVKKAKENGVWKINIQTGEKEQISTDSKYRGVYLLGGHLYGMYQGKIKEIYRLS